MTLLLLLASVSATLIFPPPRSLAASGPPLALDPAIALSATASQSPRLSRILARHETHLQRAAATSSASAAPASSSSPRLARVDVSVVDALAPLDGRTCYNYTLTIRPTSPPSALVTAATSRDMECGRS